MKRSSASPLTVKVLVARSGSTEKSSTLAWLLYDGAVVRLRALVELPSQPWAAVTFCDAQTTAVKGQNGVSKLSWAGHDYPLRTLHEWGMPPSLLEHDGDQVTGCGHAG